MQINNFNIKNIAIAFILLIIACSTIYINYIQNTPPYDIGLYILGSLYYVLFIIINSMDHQINLDYIQSGEAVLGSFFIYMVTHFFTDDIFDIFQITLFSFILIELFFKKIIQSRKTEQFRQGFIVLIIVTCILTFLYYRDPMFNSIKFLNTTVGYLTTTNFSNTFLYFIIILLIFSCIIIFLLLPEITLFSYGKSYSIFTGSKHYLVQFINIFLRSLFLTMTLLLLGWMAGIGYYILLSNTKIKKIYLPLIIIIYTQYLLLLINTSSYFYAIILSILFSYITYYIYKRKRLLLYDKY